MINNISKPIVSRTTLVTGAWFSQRDITRATNVKYHHSNQLIKWSILLHYSDRAFISHPVTGRAWFFFRGTLLVTRATNFEYHHSNLFIKWSILLRYPDRAFILVPVTGSGMGVPNFKTAHDTATKITQNIVPTISSIYA